LNGDGDKEEHIVNSNDLGSFYKYIDGRIGKRSSIGAIHNANNIVDTDTDEEKADVLTLAFRLLASRIMVYCHLSLAFTITKK